MNQGKQSEDSESEKGKGVKKKGERHEISLSLGCRRD